MEKHSKQGRRACLIAFVVPVVAMILIFIFRGIFPFGQETFLRTDMYHQYAPFFSEFQYSSIMAVHCCTAGMSVSASISARSTPTISRAR